MKEIDLIFHHVMHNNDLNMIHEKNEWKEKKKTFHTLRRASSFDPMIAWVSWWFFKHGKVKEGLKIFIWVEKGWKTLTKCF